MEYFANVLTLGEIDFLRKTYGDYLKLTVDIEKRRIIAGCVTHADGEKILLEKGSKQKNILGGGINLKDKIIDNTAVLNTPGPGGDNSEILDTKRREKFIEIICDYFKLLWH